MINKKLPCGRHQLDLSSPRVMGILNITPDSFSDGGKHFNPDDALRQAETMQRDGAAILDVGGESTRPGSAPVSLQEELDRVIPVIEKITANLDIPVSIDTSKPEVMSEAVASGAGMVNDVMALQAEGAVQVVAQMPATVSVCLMHMQGLPRTMQQNPVYRDVVNEVKGFLLERATVCQNAGIKAQRIVLDPGFGFGKTLEHNLTLLSDMEVIVAGGYPVLTGISRKSMIGAILDNAPVEQRLFGSLAAALIASQKGSVIIRVHDVKATVDVLRVAAAVR
jgi:dihydropteroate synthase